MNPNEIPQPEKLYHPNQSINALVNKIHTIRAHDLVIQQRIHQKSLQEQDYSEETAQLEAHNNEVIALRQQVVEQAERDGTDVSALIPTLR